MDDSLLPPPAVRIPDGCAVIHGDCFEASGGMEDASVDHVITDPPYSEKVHAGARGARPGMNLTTAPLINFDSITTDRFLVLCRELVRVTRRWVFMTCDWRHAAAAEGDGGIPVIRCGVWTKHDAAPQFTGDRPGVGWEAILILHREGKRQWNGGGHHAVWDHPVQRGGKHPTEKPLALVRQWVRQFTDPGETILDPFAGSGTTGEAALLEGRYCTLIEKDERWIPLINARLSRPFPKQPMTDRRTNQPVLVQFPYSPKNGPSKKKS